MVLRIAEALALPLRDRNRLLLTVGFAPEYAERPLDDPALESALQAVQRVLAGHEPYPAFAVDRHWSLLLANAAVAPVLFAGAAPHLLAPPINILRLTLHPDGLAPRIRNLPAWRAALLSYLQRQVESTGDVELGPLLDELRGYPLPGQAASLPTPSSRPAAVFLPLELASPAGELSLMSTLTTFATATDITLEEVTLECFFPAERTTADRLRSLVRA